jgi:hypothetical protein
MAAGTASGTVAPTTTRHAAGLEQQRRVPHRRARTVVVRHLGRRAHGPRRECARRHGAAPRGRGGRHHPTAHAGLRPHAPRSRLHQGLPAGRAGERRAVHPRRALVRPWPRRAWPLRPRRAPAGDAESRNHGGSPERIARYRVEPYVIAADIYGVDAHVGRGGWTWYTGSAGWMYRVAIESVLGHGAAPRPRDPAAPVHPGRLAGIPAPLQAA